MIDKEYANRLSDSIVDDLFQHMSLDYGGCYDLSRMISDFEHKREELLGDGISRLWDQLLENYKGCEQGSPLLVSEKALACLIHRGLNKKNLHMRGTNARVNLNNQTYYVSKTDAGCNAGPCLNRRWSYKMDRCITFSGGEFADFVFEFDETLPEFVKKIDKRLQVYKIMASQYEILCQTVDGLGELFLKPKGIHWHTETNFTDTEIAVTFTDDKHQPLHCGFPISELSAAIQSIPDRMSRQPLIPKLKHTELPEFFFPWDGDKLL